MKKYSWLFLLLLNYTYWSSASDLDLNYLKQMPAPGRVLVEIKGIDNIETKAKQFAAMWHLSALCQKHIDCREVESHASPEEAKLMMDYHLANTKILNEVNLFSSSEKTRWNTLTEKFKSDENFLNEIMNHFFTKDWLVNYEAQVKKINDENKKMNDEFWNQPIFKNDKQEEKSFIDPSSWYGLTLIIILKVICVVMTFRIIFKRNFFKVLAGREGKMQVIISGKRYLLSYLKGTVVSALKSARTRVTAQGGGGGIYNGAGYNNPIRIDTKTSIIDNIIYLDTNGTQHSIQLLNFDFICAEGNEFIVFDAKKLNKSNSEYFEIENLSTSKSFFNHHSLKLIFQPSWIGILPFLLINFVLIVLFFPTDRLAEGMIIFSSQVFFSWIITVLIARRRRAKQFIRDFKFEDFSKQILQFETQ